MIGSVILLRVQEKTEERKDLIAANKDKNKRNTWDRLKTTKTVKCKDYIHTT